MTDFVAKQTIVNTIKNHFSSGNVIIDLFLGVLVTTVTGLLFNNLNKMNIIFEKIVNYFKIKESVKKEYSITIEDNQLPMSNPGISETYSNKLLIFSIIEYMKKNSNLTYLNGKIELDNAKNGTNQYVQHKNRKLIFKPTEEVTITGEFAGMTVTYSEETKKYDKTIKHTKNLIIKSKISSLIINKFIKKCYDEYIIKEFSKYKNKKEKYLISMNHLCHFSKTVIEISKTFDDIFFKDKKRLLTHVDKFMNNKLKKNSKFVLLLHGPPGTGKTSLIKALSNYTDRHIQNNKLSEFKMATNLQYAFYNDKLNTNNGGSSMIIPQNKRIHVLEEIDVDSDIVHDRNTKVDKLINVDKVDKLGNNYAQTITLSDVLQLFDGLYERPGLFFVITTNNLEKLDPAFTRPGRTTMTLYLGKMAKEDAFKLIKTYYEQDNIEKIFDCIKDDIITPAELEGLCNESDTVEELKKSVIKFISSA